MRARVSVCAHTGRQLGGKGRVLPLHWLSIAVSHSAGSAHLKHVQALFPRSQRLRVVCSGCDHVLSGVEDPLKCCFL